MFCSQDGTLDATSSRKKEYFVLPWPEYKRFLWNIPSHHVTVIALLKRVGKWPVAKQDLGADRMLGRSVESQE